MPADERFRDLQRRAYGPRGGLSPAEAQELARLQASARTPVVAPPAAVAPRTTEEPASRRSGYDGETGGEASSASEAEGARLPAPESGAEGRDGRRSAGRRRLLMTALVAACALLLGLGAGWLSFGRDPGPAMDAKQRAALAELEESGDYDPASIRMLGEQYGITAWYATQNQATVECLLLRTDGRQTASCMSVRDPDDEDMNFGRLSAQVELGDDVGTTVNAYLLSDVHGAPVVAIQRWDSRRLAEWTESFQGTELAIAEVLVDAGYEGPSLQIVGYDGETPIWYDSGSCLMVADTSQVIAEGCGRGEDLSTRLTLPGVTYELRFGESGQVFTVLRGGDDGPAIDDTTGEQVE